MSILRVRVLKRHTSLEATDWEEFYRTELLRKDGKPDLDLSVFDVEMPHLVQTHAEYVVNLLRPPLSTLPRRLRRNRSELGRHASGRRVCCRWASSFFNRTVMLTTIRPSTWRHVLPASRPCALWEIDRFTWPSFGFLAPPCASHFR